MKKIADLIHPDLISTSGKVLKREAARGIILRESKILLLFTERYNDFSLPGGGIAENEDIYKALHRELEEETGAQDITVVDHYGYIEELRPYWKPEFDLMQMTSHFFVCNIGTEQSTPKMETYEIDNGMRPIWIDLEEALKHNESVIKSKDKSMGQSIQRETFMLNHIKSNHNF